jgi:GT2 family glycosyltransferase
VVVVTWNGRHHLERCLPSLVDSLERLGAPSEVFIVDNGSTDGSSDLVAATYPSIELIRNEENKGFSAANNQAIVRARGRYIATLNDDTQVDPDWLVRLVAVLESDPRMGMAAAELRYLQRPTVLNSAGITVDLAGVASDRLSEHPISDGEAQPIEVFGACAAGALYRRELLRALDGFDESFFAYLEDVDLAWRARRAGWTGVYVPGAVVLHEYSATSKRQPTLKLYLSARNRVWLLVKNASTRQLLRYGPYIVLHDLAETLYALIRERNAAALRGRLAALRGIRGALTSRRTYPFLPLDAFSEPRPVRTWVRGPLRRLRARRAASVSDAR